MEIKKLLEDAVPSKFFNLPPFYVETFTAGSCVLNKNGVNCLTFKSKLGAIFASQRRRLGKFSGDAEKRLVVSDHYHAT